MREERWDVLARRLLADAESDGCLQKNGGLRKEAGWAEHEEEAGRKHLRGLGRAVTAAAARVQRQMRRGLGRR